MLSQKNSEVMQNVSDRLDVEDWGMMSNRPDTDSGHYFGTDSSGRDLLVRCMVRFPAISAAKWTR